MRGLAFRKRLKKAENQKGEMRYAADNSDFTDKIFTGDT